MKKLFGRIIRFIKGIFARKAYSGIKSEPAQAQTPSPGMIDYLKRHGYRKQGPRFAGQPAWVKAQMLDKAVAKRQMRANKRKAAWKDIEDIPDDDDRKSCGLIEQE